jgi:hypothetical protein
METFQHREWRDHDVHEDAILQAQARRVLRALTPYEILSREALARECHADGWHDGGFAAALKAAVAAGLIEELPCGFYRDARFAHREVNIPAPDEAAGRR